MSDETSLSTRLIYLHGFNSSPDSKKAQSLMGFASQNLSNDSFAGTLEVLTPVLPSKPAEAIEYLTSLMEEEAGNTCLMGSSLGGYYSIFLAQQKPCKVVLINPLVSLPQGFDKEFPGVYINPYTDEEFEIFQEDVEFLRNLEVKKIEHQENYLLLVETGDEVLDYKQAVSKLPHAKQIIIEGGTHRFENFDSLLPEVMQFLGLLDSV